MVPPYSDRIPRVPPYSRSYIMLLRIREYHSVPSAFPCSSTWTYYTFGLFPVRSPLLGKSRLISFPQGTEMFHFPWFASIPFSIDDIAVGFPHSDISGYCAPYRLAWAFRRLARPSSPPDAMASTMCAYSLDHTTPDCSWIVCSLLPENILSRNLLVKTFPFTQWLIELIFLFQLVSSFLKSFDRF